MNPLIRQFPSNQFYERRLKDAESIETRTKDIQFLEGNLKAIQNKFNPIHFYDLSYSKEENSETSKINNDEVDFIEALIKQFILVVSKHSAASSHDIVRNFQANRDKTPEE